MCRTLSVPAERSIVWMLSNSFCSDGGPEPDSLLPATLHTVSVSSIWLVSSDAKPYDTGPDDLKIGEKLDVMRNTHKRGIFVWKG